MLILKIENFDQLADGGPISFRADRRGFDFGREQHLDWTLPDPTRRISGKHCEIRYRDGGYWLYDVSTNGTFVNKNERRVQSPYLLVNGDELQVGDYVISATVQGQQQAFNAAPASSMVQPAPVDLWSSPTHPPPPISRRELMPEQQRNSRSADYLNSIADVPPPVMPEAWHEPPRPAPPPPPVADLWAPTGAPRRAPPSPQAEWPAQAETQQPSGYSMASVAREVPFAAPPVQRPQPSTPRQPAEPERPPAMAQAGPAADMARAQAEEDFLRQFALGAGIPESVLVGRRAPELAYELGGLMRQVAAHLMRLLKVRAETKGMVRSAERTMIQARDNNALKFTPTPEAALSVVFGPAANGYLDVKQTFERSFGDVLAHEEATFAAMQQALLELVADLTPEAIEGNAANVKISFLGNAKARNWETFVERWAAKSSSGDNGVLDAYLDLFAAHYDLISNRRRK